MKIKDALAVIKQKESKIRIGGNLRHNQKFVGHVKVSFCAVCGIELKRHENTCGMYACTKAWASRNNKDMQHMTLEQKRDWYLRDEEHGVVLRYSYGAIKSPRTNERIGSGTRLPF